jgi:hypothetical protein
VRLRESGCSRYPRAPGETMTFLLAALAIDAVAFVAIVTLGIRELNRP